MPAKQTKTISQAQLDKAASEKKLGSAAFKSKDFKGALSHFSKAISASPADETLWANRAAVATILGQYKIAIRDSQKVISLKPEWSKGYARLGAAYLRMKDYKNAKQAYGKGLSKDPESAVLKTGIARTRALEQGREYKPNGGDRRTQGKGQKDEFKKGAGEFDGETVIGIDLGTTFSCVGVWQDGGVRILPNENGNLTTPSWVSFTDEGKVVGDKAKSQAAKNTDRTLYNIKRIIGRDFDECSGDIGRMPFKVTKGAGDKPIINVDTKLDGKVSKFLPEQVSAMVLTKMKQIAEKALGHPITKAVVTVPAYFNDMQRRLTKDAGAIAGLEVLRIINEPTAAALSYGLHTKSGGNILVFDLGGGTFDVSLLKIEDGIFRVLATAGDTHLGGEDFDIAMAEHLAREHTKKIGKDIFNTNATNMRKLRQACENAKKRLSKQKTTDFELYIDGEEVLFTITRKQFNKLNEGTFQRCLTSVKQVLNDAKTKKHDVSDIVLVGGSTRVPRVQAILSEYFDGKALCAEVNPDEAVAFGAAVQAAILGGVQDPTCRALLLVDVIPISLGVGCEGNQFAPVVPRNTAVPCKKTKDFTTVQDYQTSIDIPIYEGERKNCSGNHLLGEFTINGIHRAKKGEAKVDVTFEVSSDGLLTVTAKDRETGVEANVEIQHDKGRLSPEDIKKLQAEAKAMERDDERLARAYEEKRAREEAAPQTLEEAMFA